MGSLDRPFSENGVELGEESSDFHEDELQDGKDWASIRERWSKRSGALHFHFRVWPIDGPVKAYEFCTYTQYEGLDKHVRSGLGTSNGVVLHPEDLDGQRTALSPKNGVDLSMLVYAPVVPQESERMVFRALPHRVWLVCSYDSDVPLNNSRESIPELPVELILKVIDGELDSVLLFGVGVESIFDERPCKVIQRPAGVVQEVPYLEAPVNGETLDPLDQVPPIASVKVEFSPVGDRWLSVFVKKSEKIAFEVVRMDVCATKLGPRTTERAHGIPWEHHGEESEEARGADAGDAAPLRQGRDGATDRDSGAQA